MWKATELKDTLQENTNLIFYDIMDYPIPKDHEVFLYDKKSNKKTSLNTFSRNKKNPHMNEYLAEVEKMENLYKGIPFVEEIYLCNSITFNALHAGSDIDLFIITQPGRIRSTKFRAMLIFFFSGRKRTLSKKKKKVCLSFFITNDQKNLYNISIPNIDIYLCYRVQHLVLLYQDEEKKGEKSIFQQNKWVKAVLPNYQQQQVINIGNTVFSGKSKIKIFLEKIGKGSIGDAIEGTLKYLQLFIINTKRIFAAERNKDVIVNDSMLKFHQDIRQKIHLLYTMKTKNMNQKLKW